MGDFHGDLEGEQVTFVRGAVADDGAVDIAAGFLVIEGVVLDIAHDVFGLNTLHQIADHAACQQRIFSGVFEIASVARLAGDVDAAADGHVVALRPKLPSDDVAVGLRCVDIPARGGPARRGQQRGVAAHHRGKANTDGRVLLVDAGNAETLDAADEPCSSVVVGRDGLAGPQRSPADAVHELDLFVERQLLLYQVGALVRRQRFVIPGVMLRRRLRRLLSAQRWRAEHGQRDQRAATTGAQG